MSELVQKDGDDGGAAGYPILATCVSGMELLGSILYPKDYNRHKDWDYFEHYWSNYLAVLDAKYQPFGKIFWVLVRHGVAHTYMAKSAITVTKGDKSNHLVFHANNKRFNIDCMEFYLDLSGF
jgi:hypothetical protein